MARIKDYDEDLSAPKLLRKGQEIARVGSLKRTYHPT